MATSTLVSVAEYLANHYRPDREYIDGELLERNVGELDHSRLQKGMLRVARTGESNSLPRP